MKNPDEDPRANQAVAGGRSESGPDPDSAGSQESTSDSQTVAEQSIHITSPPPSIRPLEREELERLLSSVYKDPAEVDAVIKEIGVPSGGRVLVSINVLESVLSPGLDTQGDRLDMQREEIRAQREAIDRQGDQIGGLKGEVGSLRGEVRAQGVKIDAQGAKLEEHGKELASLGTEVRAQGVKLDRQGDQIGELKGEVGSLKGEVGELKGEVGSLKGEVRAQGVKIDAQGAKLEEHGKELASLGTEVRAHGVKIDAHDAKLDAHGEKLASLSTKIDVLDVKQDERFKAIRRQNRFMMALFALLIALGIFGWLGQSCSRPVESNAQGEASQEVVGPSGDGPTSAAASREPSAEPRETDDSIGDDESTEADGERPVADPDDRR